VEAAVNGNAAALSSLLEGGVSRDEFGFSTVPVDCTSDATAFDQAFLDSAPLDPVILEIEGVCAISGGILDVVGRQILITVKAGSTGTLSAQSFNLTSGMLWIDGAYIDSPTGLIRFGSFANGYIRLSAAFQPDSPLEVIDANLLQDPVEFRIFRGSDLRILSLSSPISVIRADNGSTVTLNDYSGSVSDVQLSLNSSLWCRFCFNDFTGTVQARVNSAFLADFTDPGWTVSGSFVLEHGSVARVDGSAPVDPNDVTLTPDSVFSDDPPIP
jgi:hypothetical protein